MRCSKCKEDKNEESFYRRSDRPKSRQSRCKSCVSNKDLPWNALRYKAAITRKSTRKLRKEVLLHYSDGLLKCNCCGESNYEFLTLDHIHGNGRKHRESLGNHGTAVFRDLRKNNYPEGYQILCYNCNCGRAKNNGVCPHEEI